MKKFVSLLTIFVLPTILYVSCCKCDTRDYFLLIGGIKSKLYTSTNNVVNDTLKVIDTLKADIFLNINTVAKKKPSPLLNFANPSYACKCNLNIKGYKYKIDSIKITSDKVFNGISVGQNLNAFFKAKVTSSNSNVISYTTIEQWIENANFKNYQYSIELVNSTTPLINKVHKFTFLLYSDGQSYPSVSDKFVSWQ